MHTDEHRLNEITEQIIGGAYQVANTLGVGFLEKVYENALAHELRKRGLKVLQQHPINVIYDGVIVGEYVVDLYVEDAVLVELKVAKALEGVHTAICINYLKCSAERICLLINFGVPRIEIKRLMN